MTTNPFSVSRISAGQIPLLGFFPGQFQQIIERFESCGFRGQIVGPHGSGKTTLTVAMASELAVRFLFRWFVIRKSGWLLKSYHLVEQSIDQPQPSVKHDSRRNVAVVDGTDMLSSRQRTSLLKLLDVQYAGVIFTSHGYWPSTLPLLVTIEPTFDLFRNIVEHLEARHKSEQNAAEQPIAYPNEAQIHAAYRDCQSNLRDALFQLYDLFERENRIRSR